MIQGFSNLEVSVPWHTSALRFDFISIAWLTVVLVLSGTLYSEIWIRRKYPPGPRGLPYLGNVFQISGNVWVPFNKWKKQYGPIVYINVIGQPMIVLNTYKAAADLLDRRSNIYSDRARNIVASDILTGGKSMGLIGYGEHWRKLHKAASEGLHKGVLHKFYAPQSVEAAILTYDLLKDPLSWPKHLKRAGTSMISSVTYGLPVLKSSDDPAVARINEHVMRVVHAAHPFAYLVDIFPAMRHLPSWMAKWKRDAEEWYRKDSAMHESMYTDAKARNLMNGDESNLVAMISAVQKKIDLSNLQAAWLAAQIYTAGSESTATILEWFMLMMLHHPEVLRKAQAELDAVVGTSRMPTFADYEHLHYIRAIVKETMRWSSVGPVAIPHRSTQDDWYEGYFIPKGTVCLPNVMGMNKDPEVWGPDAEEFNPSRHLDTHGKIAPSPADTKEEGHTTYGFGRRICPGRHVANNSLFIDIACILWACDIEPIRNKDGAFLLPSADECVNSGVGIWPVPFKCSITARFPFTESVVTQTKESYGH